MQVREDPASGPQARCGRRVRPLRAYAAAALAAALIPLTSARADLIVPVGGTYTTNGGQTDLACTDVVVGGLLVVDSGSLVNVRHLTIQAGGTVVSTTGTIRLGGDWNNAGTFVAGSGVVQFRDLCGLTLSAVAGSTTFANASFVSGTGKTYRFAVGTTQSVSGVLEIAGTTPNPIQFRSSSAGQVASINLFPAGAQQIQHVGVTDVWATGQWLAPSLTNEGGGGNANRWFGSGPPLGAGHPIPTLGDLATLALAALLALAGLLDLRRRHRDRAHVTSSHRLRPRDPP